MLKGWLFFLGSFFLTSSAFAVAPDVNGDGDREFLLWNGASGVFRAIDSSGRLFQRQCGLPGDIPLFSNLEGDARSEMTVWRPATQPGQPSTFYVCRDSGVATISLGSSGDRPFSQFDFDGDDRTDFTVYRPATAQWFISRSNQGGALDVRTWGQEGDVPVPGDYDGDGLADIGVFRPREGTWWIVQSATNSLKNVAWGLPHDIPVPRDYDGDNKVATLGHLDALDHDNIAVVNTGIDHGVALDRDHDGPGRLANEVLVDEEKLPMGSLDHVGSAGTYRKISQGPLEEAGCRHPSVVVRSPSDETSSLKAVQQALGGSS